jgi:hypothetical protein
MDGMEVQGGDEKGEDEDVEERWKFENVEEGKRVGEVWGKGSI